VWGGGGGDPCSVSFGKRKREELDFDFDPADILPEHIPQAFSHFSFQFSEWNMLVCDLQVIYLNIYVGVHTCVPMYVCMYI